jgi:HK97 family phage major capsid protein
MDPELKKLLDEQSETFAAFKAANDDLQAQVKKLGAADAVVADKVDKLNAQLDESAAAIKKRADEIETKLNRLALGGGGASDAEEAKAAARFAEERGQAIDLDEYRAYKKGLLGYMRKGARTGEEQKTMSVGSDPDGGYTVTPDMTGRIVKKIFETSPMRQVAAVTTIGTDRMEGFNDRDENGCGWVGETQPRPATGTAQLGKWEIPVHEIWAFPQTTQKLLDDSMFDIEAWLADKTSDKFTRTENTGFVTGDGVLKPRGLLSYDTAATDDATRAWGVFQHTATGTSAGFGTTTNGTDKLIDLVYSVKAAYRQGAAFLMNRQTVGAVRKLKDGQGNYVWQPSLSAMQGGLLLGFPITEMEDFPAIAANSLSIAFGNFKEAYQIIDRVGIRVLRDALTNKGFVGFYTTKRVGGAALDFDAAKFLKFGTS